MNNFVAFIALGISSGGFSGFLFGKITGKRGRGGGLAGSILALLMQVFLLYVDAGWRINFYFALIALLLGLIVIKPAEKFLAKQGKRKRHTGEYVEYDFNETNIDEIVGQFIAGFGAFVIQSSFFVKILVLLISFVAFRYFDVKKPLGIKKVEDYLKNFNTSMAVMFDDVLGGIYAMAVGFWAAVILL